MTVSSKYTSETNPLGTQKLQRTYLIAADNIVIEQLYANIILQQPSLDVSKLSSGLATSISTFQDRMKRNANFVLTKVVPDFITVLGDVSNFSKLTDASLSTGLDYIQNAYQDTDSANAGTSIASNLANKAGEIGIHVNTLNDDYAVANQTINQYVDGYKTSISEAIALLGDSAKQASTEIDELQAAITKNIKDIVEGGDEVGGAITNLTTGILTQFTGAGNDPKPKSATDGADKEEDDEDEDEEEDEDEDDEDADEKGKDKVDDKLAKVPATTKPGTAPDVDFAVQAIKASKEGMAKASEAAHLLTINNQNLEAAYQKMAKENALMAIAKVMQVQNQLFLDGLANLSADATALKTEWAAVESAYADFGQQIGSVKEQSEAADLRSGAVAARALWNALRDQLSYVNNSLSGLA
ncbi:HBL/NHE enterotoxin family protein [Spirosoma fluviale]|uniref:Haemolytic enterotoxin (HBL) n=1 Tax=Spirosoma fluviale TaxID=1597977 RepID=A0A286GRL0_9BACT|nr:HBL/NHE enterotoxin family protein [Spirosoma fluviale]SOD97806.1 haemolytic enterotoxin (HBL) [Spirosoma fluviale]